MAAESWRAAGASCNAISEPASVGSDRNAQSALSSPKRKMQATDLACARLLPGRALPELSLSQGHYSVSQRRHSNGP